MAAWGSPRIFIPLPFTSARRPLDGFVTFTQFILPARSRIFRVPLRFADAVEDRYAREARRGPSGRIWGDDDEHDDDEHDDDEHDDDEYEYDDEYDDDDDSSAT